VDKSRPGGAAEGSPEDAVAPYPSRHLEASGVCIVDNPNYTEGMLSSVQAGVAAADPATTLFLIALADQPSIPPELIADLIEVFDDRRPGMLIPTFDGRRGHPLLIDARYRDELATLNPEVGLRELLQRHPVQLLLHPVSVEAIIRDLDTREEYEAELTRWQKERDRTHHGDTETRREQ
jgi:molybdenum cofactor cytidylyltransferase